MHYRYKLQSARQLHVVVLALLNLIRVTKSIMECAFEQLRKCLR